MDLGLGGKTAIVTGGTKGIGRAIALALANEGAKVAVCARGEDGLEEMRGALGFGHLTVAADVTTAAGADLVVARTVEELGGVDLLVNNVGGSAARTFDAADEADFRAILERNLFTALAMSKRCIPSMRTRGGGSICMIASIWGREAGGGPSYNVAKAAEISLGKAMARDLAKDNIRVNTVAPGSIFFPGGGWERRQKADPAFIADMVARDLPFGRFGTPEEVAAVVAFVLSPRASWVSGACIPVDGVQGRAF